MRRHSRSILLVCGFVILLGSLRARQAPSSALAASSLWRVTATRELKGITRASA